MKSALHSHLLLLPPLLLAGAVILMLSLSACNQGEDTTDAPQTEEADGLSEWELEHGIGPITEPVALEGEIDQQMAARGEDAYATKCESCHRMDNRFVGPPLGNILETRSPEFVMNFMLNPQEMIREHPIGQQLLAEYMVEMPYQNVSEEEARAILEYLRTESN